MTKTTVKVTVKIVVLAAVMAGAFIAASVQQIPTADGGPLILCPPRQANCSSTLPPA